MQEFNAQLDLDKMKFNEASKFKAFQRSREWEIEKMSLRSQADFARDEAKREQRLSSIDKKLMQLEKEKDAGRFSNDDTAFANAVTYWKAQKDFIETGTRAPTVPWEQHPMMYQTEGAIAEREDEQFGIPPYWMQGKEAPEGSPERQLYETKLQQGISGQRGGTVPWDLRPESINDPIAKASRENRGIYLEDYTAPEVEQQQQITAPQYKIGQTVKKGGKTYTVVGFDTDGEPMVELQK